jgi:hypothetical protein
MELVTIKNPVESPRNDTQNFSLTARDALREPKHVRVTAIYLPKNAKIALAKSEAVEKPLTTEEHSTANAKLVVRLRAILVS